MKTIGMFEARFGGFPADHLEALTDALMTGLDAHPLAMGPMVVADKATRELVLSFEFVATGNVNEDMPRALDILRAAVPLLAPPGAAEGIDAESVVGWITKSTVELAYA